MKPKFLYFYTLANLSNVLGIREKRRHCWNLKFRLGSRAPMPVHPHNIVKIEYSRLNAGVFSRIYRCLFPVPAGPRGTCCEHRKTFFPCHSESWRAEIAVKSNETDFSQLLRASYLAYVRQSVALNPTQSFPCTAACWTDVYPLVAAFYIASWHFAIITI